MKKLTVVVACLAFSQGACAQEFPAKPIRVITQFTAGAGGDLLSRIVATYSAPLLGQPVIVENRPGAGGALAVEAVARSAPDGYTLTAATTNTQIIRVYLVRNQTFNPVTDFTPITRVGESNHLLVAANSLPVSNVRELIEYARRNPGKVSYGTAGVGSIHHLAGEQLKMLAGVEMVHIPYKSTAQASLDIVAGVLPLAFDIAGSSINHVKAGKMKAIGIMGDARYAALPNVGTIAEAVPGYQTPPSWSGMFGPAHLPGAVLRRLNTDLVRALNLPEARTKAEEIGFTLKPNSPEEFSALIQTQLALVGRIVKGAKIEPLE